MELSYASKKIRNKKRLNKFKLFLVVLFAMLFVTALAYAFYTFLNPHLKWVYDSASNISSIIIFITLAFVLSVISFILMYFHLNKQYKIFHQALLENEAMLDGLALFKNTNGLNDVERKFIKDYILIHDFKEVYSFTQTSSQAYFDLFQLKHDKDKYDVLIKTKIDFLYNEMIILRNDNKKGKLSYNEKNLKQYGLGTMNNSYLYDKNFALYATLDNKIYTVLNYQIIKELYDFQNFIKTNLCLVLFDDNLFILIKDWKINMYKSIFAKESINIVDIQIEALKKLQNYIEAMTMLIKNQNENEMNNEI